MYVPIIYIHKHIHTHIQGIDKIIYKQYSKILWQFRYTTCIECDLILVYHQYIVVIEYISELYTFFCEC